jgi:hypothetical protein
MRSFKWSIVITFVVGLLNFSVNAVTAIPTSSSKPVIDGIISQGEWGEPIREIKYVAYPNKGAAARDVSLVYLSSDESNIYIAINAKSSTPVKGVKTRRDNLNRSDYVSAFIAPGERPERSYYFQVTPTGAQGDQIFSSFGKASYSWDGEWTSKASINSDGYVVELAIPLSNIEMGDSNLIRMIFKRAFVTTSFEFASDIIAKDNSECPECDYPVYELKVERDVKQSTYNIIPGISYIRTSSEGQSEDDYNVSLDANYRTEGGTELTATINPDFSDANLDSIQNNLNTRFELFLPENRRFFTQNQANTSISKELFNSRNLVDPDFGLIASEQNSTLGYSAMFMKDDYTSFLLPGFFGSTSVNHKTKSNNFIGSADYTSGQSKTSGYITNKTSDILDNAVIGLNTRYDFSDQINGSFFYSKSSSSGDGFDDYDGSMYTGDVNFNTGQYFSSTKYENIDSMFLPALGFLNRVGFKALSHESGYIFRFKDNKWVQSYTPTFKLAQHKDENGEVFLKERRIVNELTSSKLLYTLEYDQDQELIGNTWFEQDSVQHLMVFKPVESLEILTIKQHGKAVDYELFQSAHENLLVLQTSYTLSSTLSSTLELQLGFQAFGLKTDGHKRFKFEGLDLGTEYHFNNASHLKLILQTGSFEIFLPGGAGKFMSENTKQAQLVYSFEMDAFSKFAIGGNWSDTDIQAFNYRELQNGIFAKFTYNIN